MNLFTHFRGELLSVLEGLRDQAILPSDANFTSITVEPPRDPSHGDIALNAAMVLAKPAKMKPRDLAEKIVEGLIQLNDVEKADIAGPGFINITITPSFWQKIIIAALDEQKPYGRSDLGQGHKVNVEFVSANPTGPMHVGHCRGAVFGDALANLLDYAGYDVTREYYINDAGAQVDVLARSAYLRYLEALGDDIGDIPEGLYPGDYMKPVGEALAEQFGDQFKGQDESEWLETVRDISINAMMEEIRGDLKALNIEFDSFFSERSLKHGNINLVADSIEDMREKGLIYEGTLPPPKGKLPDDWDEREQTLFKATDFGDDVDRALAKADSSYTYFASDIAYHRDKYNRGFTSMIDVLGADHSGYVKRMKAAVNALSGGKAELDVKICQLVRLLRGGKPVKMSKRSGTFITLREVVDEVGPDVVRFIMLYRKNDASLDFDFDKVQEQSKDNPVFYVQYAHARSHSVLYRKIPDEFPELDIDKIDPATENLSLLVDSGELLLIKKLAQYPRIVEQAANTHEPHRIAFYLYELASELHTQWNRGTEKPELRFISVGNRKVTGARAVLVKAVAKTLASGLGILGVHPIDEMR
jgi:arginyl-tRNA synthetase